MLGVSKHHSYQFISGHPASGILPTCQGGSRRRFCTTAAAALQIEVNIQRHLTKKPGRGTLHRASFVCHSQPHSQIYLWHKSARRLLVVHRPLPVRRQLGPLDRVKATYGGRRRKKKVHSVTSVYARGFVVSREDRVSRLLTFYFLSRIPVSKQNRTSPLSR